ncbi:MAG: STAS domain-containing protein [Oscillospiraceae bacterium]|nr:STAS domain-containing protein [Oscillospiraceae bacterium]
MPVYTEYDGEYTLIAKITGEIDHHSAKWLRADIDTAINDYKPLLLKLDFSGVTFMDSSGVGLVMGRNLGMKEIGGRVELSNMPPYIEKVMSIAGMDKLTGTDFSKGGLNNGTEN